MAIEYLGLSEINGPLVVLEGVQNAAYDEIVEMTVLSSCMGIRPLSRFLREQKAWPCAIPIPG